MRLYNTSALLIAENQKNPAILGEMKSTRRLIFQGNVKLHNGRKASVVGQRNREWIVHPERTEFCGQPHVQMDKALQRRPLPDNACRLHAARALCFEIQRNRAGHNSRR